MALHGWKTITSHSVFNQVAELNDYNAFLTDPFLQHCQKQFGAAWAADTASRYGQLVGGELRQAGIEANHYLPEYNSHDAIGNRIEEVSYHPAYHRLMTAAMDSGWPMLPWNKQQPGSQVARAVMEYLHHQADAGSGCPLTMSYAGWPVLRDSSLGKVWRPLLLSNHYDEQNRPLQQKQGLTLGMGMTEKQGGTDVNANTTQAKYLGTDETGELYSISGHKWFLSAPMSDGFLVLAQAKGGLTCFLLPRWCPDGSLNNLFIQRLKNKLGNRSNASSEVEFKRALAWRIGEEGRGVATIIKMVALTRFDCMTASAGLMRQALTQAIHHCRQRKVFGQFLIDQPLMKNVLTDLVMESQASLVLAMRTAEALDKQASDEQHALLVRIITALGKYWVCKRAPGFIYEAMECMGGNAYVETSLMPRLFREAPVNAIWEGSGNVQCLDVLRSIEHNRACLDSLLDEINLAAGHEPSFDRYVNNLKQKLHKQTITAFHSRQLVAQLVCALQASLLLRTAPPHLAELFCQQRLTRDYQQYGGLSSERHCTAILEYAWQA